MQKSFEVIKRKGKTFKVFDLPNTNCFFFKCVSNIGSNMESKIFEEEGKNYFGMMHLIEHLCFKNPIDFTTDEFTAELRKYGSHNAYTRYDDVGYHYYATSQHFKEAVKIVMNAAYNDLSRLKEDEFLLERGVVENEAEMYYNNPEVRFYRSTRPLTSGGHVEDTIVGIKDTICTFTMDDVKSVRKTHLKNYKEEFVIEYDSNRLMLSDIIRYIEDTYDRITSTIDLSGAEIKEDIEKHNYVPKNGISVLKLPTKQTMVYLLFPLKDIINTEKNVTISDALFTFGYLLNFAKDTNLYKMVREDRGLTYRINLGEHKIGEDSHLGISLNVSPEKYDEAIKAVKESIRATAESFNNDDYIEYLNKEEIKNTLYNVKENDYSFILSTYERDKPTFKEIESVCKNIDLSNIYGFILDLHKDKINDNKFSPRDVYAAISHMLEVGDFFGIKAIDDEK